LNVSRKGLTDSAAKNVTDPGIIQLLIWKLFLASLTVYGLKNEPILPQAEENPRDKLLTFVGNN
jgi:hypothetical protein